jgi:2-oxoisovalerate dehydrogenase E1 component
LNPPSILPIFEIILNMMELTISEDLKKDIAKEEILNDYRIACESRHASLFGRKEVFMGKAKFGIFGDGKEIAQIAMAKAFKPGDHRSGYYRDQTFMMAIGEHTLNHYFAQLYAHPDVEKEPASAGRLMNGHFATRIINEDGTWKELSKIYNSSSDISPTAAQMPRLVGLGYASKLFRENPLLHQFTEFSNKGNEVAFGTIGNASTAEGLFWEAVNAIGVLQVPVLLSIWDDGYGISVPNEYQVTKSDISKILEGFRRNEKDKGFELFKVKGWDYEGLCKTYQRAAHLCRTEHVPVIIHVDEMTQPQGHSTSGSHERYKSKERLKWEAEYDCIKKMREWILENNLSTAKDLDKIETTAKETVKAAKHQAWDDFQVEILKERKEVLALLDNIIGQTPQANKIKEIQRVLEKTISPLFADNLRTAKKALRIIRFEKDELKKDLQDWIKASEERNERRFNSHLHSESYMSALNVSEVKPAYDEDSPLVDGREVLQTCFDAILTRDPKVFAIGEDVGKIGDVNQAFAGLQAKHGELRVTDTGIREATIIGQGIGTALRGLRPIAEIQYLDYMLYALQTLSDDLASLHYRTRGGQKAPLIIRTRGHRLEGVWHSGSPMGMMLHSLRGIYILVPRDMTRAAGFYNTMLQSDDPAVIVESLNGYRLKEKIPTNIGEFTIPLGVPEVLREGTDVTIVTYGSMCRIVMDAAAQLEEIGISAEVIDVQTLLPFDIHHKILESVKKTNKLVFTDEDVPGGATAFMLQKVLEEQQAYFYLDAKPITIPAKEHRPAYSSDGDYFSKPNTEEVFDRVYELMNDYQPGEYPKLY